LITDIKSFNITLYGREGDAYDKVLLSSVSKVEAKGAFKNGRNTLKKITEIYRG